MEEEPAATTATVTATATATLANRKRPAV
eukprot:SAG11_NODE_37715_length_255_cov_1.320513_1_plen_28_part_10